MMAAVFGRDGYGIVVQLLSGRSGEDVAAYEALVSGVVVEEVFEQSRSSLACRL